MMATSAVRRYKELETRLDALKVTERVVTKSIDQAVKPNYASVSKLDKGNATQRISDAKEQLDMIAVVALAAAFERTVRLHILKEYETAFSAGTPFLSAILAESKDDIEYWNISERLLGVFPSIDGNVLGLTKQVIGYRNWVAHGRWLDHAPTDGVVSPRAAYDRLTAFLQAAGLVT